MPLEDCQLRFKDDGIVLNSDAATPFVDISSIDGLDSAEVRTFTEDYAGMDGGHVEALWRRPRTVVIAGTAYAPEGRLAPYLDQLKANYAPSDRDLPLYFRDPGNEERIVFAKPTTGVRYAYNEKARISSADIQITLTCADPRIYSIVESSPSVGLSAGSAARSYPKTYPTGYLGASGDPQTGGVLFLDNKGNDSSPPILRFTGPSLNPRASNVTTGEILRLNTTLGDTDYVDVDMFAHTITLNGTASRRHLLAPGSSFWFLKPGVNQINFLASSYQANARLRVTYRSAWH